MSININKIVNIIKKQDKKLKDKYRVTYLILCCREPFKFYFI